MIEIYYDAIFNITNKLTKYCYFLLYRKSWTIEKLTYIYLKIITAKHDRVIEKRRKGMWNFASRMERKEIFFNFPFHMKKKCIFIYEKQAKLHVSCKKKKDFFQFLFFHVRRKTFIFLFLFSFKKRVFFSISYFVCKKKKEIVFSFFFLTITLKHDLSKKTILNKDKLFTSRIIA